MHRLTECPWASSLKACSAWVVAVAKSRHNSLGLEEVAAAEGSGGTWGTPLLLATNHNSGNSSSSRTAARVETAAATSSSHPNSSSSSTGVAGVRGEAPSREGVAATGTRATVYPTGSSRRGVDTSAPGGLRTGVLMVRDSHQTRGAGEPAGAAVEVEGASVGVVDLVGVDLGVEGQEEEAVSEEAGVRGEGHEGATEKKEPCCTNRRSHFSWQSLWGAEGFVPVTPVSVFMLSRAWEVHNIGEECFFGVCPICLCVRMHVWSNFTHLDCEEEDTRAEPESVDRDDFQTTPSLQT